VAFVPACGRASLVALGDVKKEGINMLPLHSKLWTEDEGQDIAEYAVMLAVILVLVVGTIRLVGSNANTAFSQAASSIQ
jgi:Flp pilus assembly pilin Flp